MTATTGVERDLLIGLVCREFGYEVVRYSLAVKEGQPWDTVEWTRPRLEVLKLLVGGLSVANLTYEGSTRQFRNAVHAYLPAAGDSIIRTARKHCGGGVASVDEGVDSTLGEAVNSLIRLINRYTMDISAQLTSATNWLPSLRDDPDARSLLRAVLEHEDLQRFKKAIEGGKADKKHALQQGCQLITPYSGTTLYDNSIPGLLLRACVTRALIHGREVTPEVLREEAPHVIDDFLALMAGRKAKMPSAVGAVGSRLLRSDKNNDFGAEVEPLHAGTKDVPLRHSDRIDAGEGYLRPALPLDQTIFSMASDHLGLVWVTEQEIEVELRPLRDSSADDFHEIVEICDLLRQRLTPVEDRWELVAQAIALSAEGFPPPGLARSECFVSSVVQPWEYSSSERRVALGESSWRQIEPSQLVELATWHTRLGEHPADLITSRRRLVTALGARDNAADALVDATVAWEGIFSGTHRTTENIVFPSCDLLSGGSTAIHMCEEMRDAYRLRSHLVHGRAADVSERDAANARDLVLAWVIELLTILFQSRTRLLGLTALERSKEVRQRYSRHKE